MSQEIKPSRPDSLESPHNMVMKILHNETLVVAVTLLLSLSAVVALAVFLRFDDWGLNLFRILVITVFTILPALMYYVFIASRKRSLLQEFVSNLSRLGLLQRQCDDDLQQDEASDRYFERTRILSYIDRFEAVYGPVGKASKIELLEATQCSVPSDCDRSISEPAGGRIFSPATAFPVFIATFLIGLGWVQFIPPWNGGEVVKNSGNATLHSSLLYNELPALFAFLGAYFFSVQMLYRRFVTNDLRASAFISVSIRIILGVIGAWLLQVLFKAEAIGPENGMYWLLFASFVIGVFPPVLWRVIRDVSGRMLILGKVVPSLDSDLPLNDLDGLTIWHQTRLEEEDIENAYNMANADIIALLVNTKMPPERIVDWVDQAILYSCLPPANRNGTPDEANLRTRLLRLGIGNASALKAVVRMVDEDDQLDDDFRSELHGIHLKSFFKRAEGFYNLNLIDHWRASGPRDSTHERIHPESAIASPANTRKTDRTTSPVTV